MFYFLVSDTLELVARVPKGTPLAEKMVNEMVSLGWVLVDDESAQQSVQRTCSSCGGELQLLERCVSCGSVHEASRLREPLARIFRARRKNDNSTR